MIREPRKKIQQKLHQSIQSCLGRWGAVVLATQIRAGARDGSTLACSIVMPTRNKATYLELTLAALEDQLLPRKYWEICIADDASIDDTTGVLQDFQERRKMQIEVVRLPQHLGVGAARNAAVHKARGRIVIFLDDDQLASPNFLLSHLLHHTREKCVVQGGAQAAHTHLFPLGTPHFEGTTPQPAFRAADWRSRNMRDELSILCLESPSAPCADWLDLSASNLSCEKQDFILVGGFDEGRTRWNLGEWGLADLELGKRLQQLGSALVYDLRATTLHQIHPFRAWDETRSTPPQQHADYFFCKHHDLDRGQIEARLVARFEELLAA